MYTCIHLLNTADYSFDVEISNRRARRIVCVVMSTIKYTQHHSLLSMYILHTCVYIYIYICIHI